METRAKLILILSSIIVLVLLVLGVLIYSILSPSSHIAVENRVEPIQTEVVKRKNPWANQGDAVISYIKTLKSTPPLFPLAAEPENKKPKSKEEVPKVPEVSPVYDALLHNNDFVHKVLQVRGKPVGWNSEWWGETKYGQSFFRVRYAFQDGVVQYGPEWLVDLKKRVVKPINLLAQIVDNPKQASESQYYDKESQIISAIASHRFDNKMSLAGALLIYFEQQTGKNNDIIGWTIVHMRNKLFRAYFQWTSNNVPQYAEFDFDFDDRKLKPNNFQATEIMKVGEDFQKDRVSIMPRSYDPSISNPSKRWIGGARKACAAPANRDNCAAFATMLEQKEIIESLEWLLTAREGKPGQFAACQDARACAWKPVQNGKNDFTIFYSYKLDPLAKEPDTISWNVNPKTEAITPNDPISALALKAIRPQ